LLPLTKSKYNCNFWGKCNPSQNWSI